MIKLLRSFSIQPIFVFDGAKFPAKRHTDEQRALYVLFLFFKFSLRQTKLKEAKELASQGDVKKATGIFSQTISISKAMMEEVLHLCIRLQIPYIISPYESDAELAFLSRTGIVDAVMSDDSDSLCFRCPCVLYKLTDTGICKEVCLDRLFQSDEFTSFPWTCDLFEFLCILSGCDYLDNLPYIRLKTAKKYIQLCGSEENVFPYVAKLPIHQYSSNYKSNLNRTRLSFRHQIVFDPITNSRRFLTPLGDVKTDLSQSEMDETCGKLEGQWDAKDLARGFESEAWGEGILDRTTDVSYLDTFFGNVKRVEVWKECQIDIETENEEEKRRRETLKRDNEKEHEVVEKRRKVERKEMKGVSDEDLQFMDDAFWKEVEQIEQSIWNCLLIETNRKRM